jgi:hypothetical protein
MRGKDYNPTIFGLSGLRGHWNLKVLKAQKFTLLVVDDNEDERFSFKGHFKVLARGISFMLSAAATKPWPI